MKKIGMLVAVELDAVLQKFGTLLEPIHMEGFDVYEYQMEDAHIYVLPSGAGEIPAAAGTQLLISVFQVDVIINFGVVGGLTKEMKLARTCVVEKVVHYDYDTSAVDECEPGRYMDEYPDVYIPTTKSLVEKALVVEPKLKKVICASGDKFIADRSKKEQLHQQYQADICEMEAAGIVLTCNRNKVPCLLIKTVSDSISGGAEEFLQAIDQSAEICLEITQKIIQEL